MADQKKYYTSTAIRVMSAEAVVVKMTKYGPIKDDEKTRQLRQMLIQAAEVQERAFSERMCALALGHASIANKVDRIMVGVDSNGQKAAVAGIDYCAEDASEDKEAIKQLCAALRLMVDNYCGNCQYRQCEADLQAGESPVPCLTVYNAGQLLAKYDPKPPQEEKADDGMPF